MSPKRCWFIHREADTPEEEPVINEGAQKITEESVDVDINMGCVKGVTLEGLQTIDVTPASCPTSSASNVTEYCAELSATGKEYKTGNFHLL